MSVTEAVRRPRRVKLHVAVDGPAVDDAILNSTCNKLKVILGLQRDLSQFHALCREHPTLHVIPLIGAGRSLRSASMTENITKALCQTNVAWPQAVKMINRLGMLGPVLPHFGNLTAWPTPQEILRAGKSYLKEVCRLGYRVESILKYCKDVCDGRIDPESLDKQASDGVSDGELLAQLCSIRGIGSSTANWLLSFLGRHDRLAVDSSTIAHVARTHTRGKKPTFRQVERIYARYGRWKNLVWWFEYWLTWDTAKAILRDARLDG